MIYDRVIRRWQFVPLPPTRLVLEMDPGTNCEGLLQDIARRGIGSWVEARDIGGLKTAVSIDGLLFALFSSALADLRTIRDTRDVYDGDHVNVSTLKERIPVWRRGQILASAGFLLEVAPDSQWALPRGAIRLSRQIVKTELEGEYVDELFAAGEAGMPWTQGFARACLRCGSPRCSWRCILQAFPGMPDEMSWRLQRPENAVPLCRSCAYELRFNRQVEIQMDMVWGLWGPRFEALLRWYRAVQQGGLPENWSRLDDPLWPKEYGGPTWERGSGALAHCRPREPKGILRTDEQRNALARALSGKSSEKPRRAEASPLLSVLQSVGD